MKKKEGEVEGEDEEGADGSVFFAAKWQRARANRVETSAATSQEYKRTTDSQATGHLLTTSQSARVPMPFFTYHLLHDHTSNFSLRSVFLSFVLLCFSHRYLSM